MANNTLLPGINGSLRPVCQVQFAQDVADMSFNCVLANHHSARELIGSAAHAHLVTLNPDGSSQVTIVWAGIDGEDIVAAHLYESKK